RRRRHPTLRGRSERHARGVHRVPRGNRRAAPDGAGEATSESNAHRGRAIRYGTVGFRGSTHLEQKVNAPEPGANTQYVFDQEAAAIKGSHDEVVAHAGVPMLEAEAVVRSLSVAMHGEGRVVAPLLQLKRFDQYTTTHAINVAVLT